MKYYLYCRKSTEESAGKQLNSLESQEQAMMQIAEREGLEVIKTYRESQSASKLGRPVLEEMLSNLQAGKADGILCWKLDRLARNMVEGGAIFQMLQDEVIKSIRCYDKEYNKATNAIVFGVELGQATQYSVELRANVNRGMMFKFRNGYWPTLAPIGYLNVREQGQALVVPNESNAPLIAELFEEFSTGHYSLREVAQHMFERGLTTRGGKKIHLQKIATILDNPFYYGLMNWKGESVQGKHKPIITKELYDKVKAVRHQSTRPRPSKHFFMYRGLFSCEDCGCSITAEKQKTYHYYHCTAGKGSCEQKSQNIREEKLTEQIEAKLDELTFDEEWVEIMYQASLEKLNLNESTTHTARENIQENIRKIESKKKKLLRKNLDEKISDEDYVDMKKELNRELTDLKISLKGLENTQDPLVTLELLKDRFLTSARAKSEFMNATDEGKQKLLKKLLSNSTVKDKNLANFQLKNPYELIARASKLDSFSRMWT